MTTKRVILALGNEAALIQAIHSASKETPQVVVAKEEKKTTAQIAMLTAASLGASIPSLFPKASLKHCSRCQQPFNHKGAYCSKECFKASNE